jgi:hypothetical protein
LLGPELLTRLQVIGVPLDLLDDVLLLDLSLEAAKGVFQRFALLKLYFSQTKYTSQLNQDSRAQLGSVAEPEKLLHFAQKVLIS